MSRIQDISHEQGRQSGDKNHGENEKSSTSAHRCTFGHEVTLATGLMDKGSSPDVAT